MDSTSLGIYYPDIFYAINKLKLSSIKQCLKDAEALSYHCRVDILDCNKSLSRKRTDLTFKDALKMCRRKTLYVFIHRRGYEAWKGDDFNPWRLEVGFRSMTTPDYFLWINCTEDKIPALVEKYNLNLIR